MNISRFNSVSPAAVYVCVCDTNIEFLRPLPLLQRENGKEDKKEEERCQALITPGYENTKQQLVQCCARFPGGTSHHCSTDGCVKYQPFTRLKYSASLGAAMACHEILTIFLRWQRAHIDTTALERVTPYSTHKNEKSKLCIERQVEQY
ncbi:hypothetical protein EK904_012730 [Melospiza melodia maxima]|nr:hypothetical protein EK904_012730 [Melospiza melodia maxima]